MAEDGIIAPSGRGGELEPTPPEIRRSNRRSQGALIALALISSNLFGLFLAGIFEFLSLRGVVSVEASRFVLCGVWAVGCLLSGLVIWTLPINNKGYSIVSSASILAVLLAVLDWWAPNAGRPVALEQKYPMGYFLFTADHQTNYIRKNSQAKADFTLDWESCRVLFVDSAVIGLVLKNFTYFPTHVTIRNLTIVVERKSGAVADGLFFDGAGLFVELIQDRADEMSWVIGIKKVSHVSNTRYMPNKTLADVIMKHVAIPPVSAFDIRNSWIEVNGYTMLSGWQDR